MTQHSDQYLGLGLTLTRRSEWDTGISSHGYSGSDLIFEIRMGGTLNFPPFAPSC